MARDEAGFLERCEEARQLALSFKDPLVVHHYDADGLSSGAIAIGALRAAGMKPRSECIKKLDDAAIERYAGGREKEVIFVDLGGGNKRVNELEDVVVIDHHQTEGISKMQANPLLFGIDGGTELSAAGTAYCVFRRNADLAVVGAAGDMQSPLSGMNRWVLEEGVKSGDVRVEEDLRFYGRYCRPLVQFLAYSDDPYLPGISYREDKARELLGELGIPLEAGGASMGEGADSARKTWRTYSDLNNDEKKRLVSALAKLLAGANRLKDAGELVGESYVFPKRQRDETYEANEFSTILNACGRHSRPDVGLRVCLGDVEARQEAAALLAQHRKALREGIAFGASHIQDFGAFYFLDGRGKIDEGIIGVICGMSLHQKWGKPLIGAALGENDTIKVSGRAPRALVANGMDLGALMRGAAEACGGVGGGHRMAAGASVPGGKINEFLLAAGAHLRG